MKTPSSVHLGTYGECRFFAYRNLDEITGLWRQLERNGTHSPFQSLAWTQAIVAAKALTGDQQHVFAVGFVGTKPVVILPFTMHRGTFGLRLTWLGEKMSDYNGIIADRSYAASMPDGLVCRVVAMLRVAFPAIQAVHLIRNPVGRFGIEQTRKPGATVSTAEFKSHSVTLQGNWTELYARLRSAKSRQRLRSKYRSLKKLGDVRFRQVRGEHERRALARRVLQWKSEQLMASGRRDPFGNAAAPSAIRKAIESAVTSDDSHALRAFGLFLDDEPVAGMLAFVTEDTFYYFVSAYTPSLDGKYSIGVQLLVRTLELASRSGLKRYDFLIGDESYKSDWCDTEMPLVNYARPFSLQGKLICLSLELRLACKKLILEKDWLSHIARRTLKVRSRIEPAGTIPVSSLMFGVAPAGQPRLSGKMTEGKFWLKTPEDA